MNTKTPLYFCEEPSPFGPLTLIASDTGLRALLWQCDLEGSRVPLPQDMARKPDHPLLQKTRTQLTEYFEGRRTEFDLPLEPEGTPFQRRAWEVLRTIPYGKTLSYQEQAVQLGDVNATRAVGAANGKNLISIIIPCHRVIGKNGSLTGFAAGVSTKAGLLALEQG